MPVIEDRSQQISRCLISLLAASLIAALSNGCHVYHTVYVSVRDGDSGEPIANAEVDPAYPTIFPEPWNAPDTTSADGIARLRLTFAYDYIGLWARAPGYINTEYPVRSTALRDSPARKMKKPTVEIVMWAKPEASFTIIVPDDYRGVITVRKRYDQAFTPVPYRRDYEAVMRGPDKPVDFPHHDLFDIYHLEARYADGRPIPARRDATADYPLCLAMIGLQPAHTRTGPNRLFYYFIGSPEECDAARVAR